MTDCKNSCNEETESEEMKTITSSSDFIETFKYLLDSQVENKYKVLEQHLNDRALLSFTKKGFKLSYVKSSCKHVSTSIFTSYFSLIICISHASRGTSPYREIVEDSLIELIKLTTYSNEICQFLYIRIIDLVLIKDEILERSLMNSVMQMNELLELFQIKKSLKDFDEYKTSFTTWLSTIISVLRYLKLHIFKVKNGSIGIFFVTFYIKLYKMFKNKTFIEADKDITEFQKVLETLELSMFVFKLQRMFLLKKLIDHWPKSYQFQIEVIKYFVQISRYLNDEEQNSIKEKLRRKFNELLLHSNLAIFEVAYKEFKKFRNNFFWYSEKSVNETKIYNINVQKLNLNNECIKESKHKQVKKLSEKTKLS